MPASSAAPSAVPLRYSSAARVLHWLTVLLVFSTIPAGTIMVQEGLPRPVQDGLFIWHKNIGPLILLVVVLRLIVRAASPPPPLPASVSPAQALAANTVHWLLYACLIVMPVSGLIRVQAGGFPIEYWDAVLPTFVGRDAGIEKAAMAVHYWTRFVLILLILGHVGAAALHGIVKRDGVFSRMWPPV